MEITRRGAMTGMATVMAVSGSQIPSVPNNHLEVLLENLRQTCHPSQAHVLPFMEDVTRRTFPAILTNKLIHVEPMTGPVSIIQDRLIHSKTRRTNATLTDLDLYTARIPDKWAIDTLSSDLAADYEKDALGFMHHTASVGPSCLFMDRSELRDLIGKTTHAMRPVGTWAVVNSEVFRILDKDVPAVHGNSMHINDIVVYHDAKAQRETPILLGSQDKTGMIWAPYVLAIPSPAIDPMTFEPFLCLRIRYGMWAEPARTEKQFVVLPTLL